MNCGTAIIKKKKCNENLFIREQLTRVVKTTIEPPSELHVNCVVARVSKVGSGVQRGLSTQSLEAASRELQSQLIRPSFPAFTSV